MNDELRAAAERLVRWGSMNDRRMGLFEQQASQMEILGLAWAYLADHPADDELPIDMLWLQSLSPVVTEGGGLEFSTWVESIHETVFLERMSDGRWMIGDPPCVEVKAPQNRGQFRRLCVALGIELKEQK